MDLVFRGGMIVTAADTYTADLAVEAGRIVQIGQVASPGAAKIIDATGCYLFPGGIDVHTHLDTPDFNSRTADDYTTGTIAAACGGTTTIIDFSRQERGRSLGEAIDVWSEKARGKAAIDYGFHVIVIDMYEGIEDDLRRLPALGVTSFKLFMAYRGLSMVDDRALLAVLDAARDCDALVMVHAENGDAADYLQKRLLSEGKTEPKYHADSRPARVEAEATARAIALAELVGAPLYVVHLTCREALDELRRARLRNVDVLAETCTHYLHVTSDDLARPGFEGAKYVFTPPARSREDQEALWAALKDGELAAVSSDHAPWNYHGQKELGRGNFTLIPNGAPGIEERMTMAYQGVATGRIDVNRFVDITATRPAKIFGLYPEKGCLAVGSDADIVVWDPRANGVITQDGLHHAVDYTLYEGMSVTGKARHVFLRGRQIVEDGIYTGEPGYGRFIKRRGPQAQRGLMAEIHQRSAPHHLTRSP
ncbi:dihydropyrimidinase [Nitratireductor sp. GZWM139]|uniref:dihydropyrimidinase n=1 Tax=Nitratireductor sp. GZWM139 TaxID=2950541 RepID=UPI0024BD8AF1|nr:dihydropyrimidinase [Nitratireductor sp. GZWM139]MDJ1466119.1 dihydropyrimidinase [Nitratireductor sp. GZWM139]